MTDYKLMPLRDELIQCLLATRGQSEGTTADAILSMIAAAPDVQGEPVGWQFYEDGKWWNGDDRIKYYRKNTEEAGFPVRDVYAAPIVQTDPWTPSGAYYDHAIHHNPDAKAWADLFVETFPGLADKHDLMMAWFANAMMAMHDYLRQEPVDQQLASCVGCEGAPAPENSPCAVCGQKYTPDVSALVEALESLLDMQDEDCRYDHQGYCQNHNLDHVEDGCRVARAKAALAAYHKQQEIGHDNQ